MAVRKITRREFLKVTAGSGGAFMAAGLGIKATDTFVPFVTPPDSTRPGVVTRFATTCRECPAGCGLIAWNRDGRTTKVEGNPDHPINRGGLCARGQSSVQGLYDPDRVKQPMRRAARTSVGGPRSVVAEDGGPRSVVAAKGEQRPDATERVPPPHAEFQPVAWRSAVTEIGARLRDGKGKVILISDLQTGSLAEVMESLARSFRSPAPLYYEAFNYEPVRSANERLFGKAVVPDPRIDQSDFLVSFGVDFLETWVSPVQYARRFAEMRSRRPSGRGSDVSPLPPAGEGGRRPGEGRFVYVGPRLSMTAANADMFIQVPPGGEAAVALAMLRVMVDKGWAQGDAAAVAKSLSASAPPLPAGVTEEQVTALAKDFAQAKAGLALAGPAGATGAAAFLAAMAAAVLNETHTGQTLDFFHAHIIKATARRAEMAERLAAITPADTVILHNTNPALTSPESVEHLRRAGSVVCLGTMMDETAALADWVLPIDSPLESWGEYQPTTGVMSLLQPTMGRVFDTRSAGDVLLSFAIVGGRPLVRAMNEPAPANFKIWLQAAWKELGAMLSPAKTADAFWRDALRAGGWWQTSLDEKPAAGTAPQIRADAASTLSISPAVPATADASAALWLWPSVFLFDGRTANRGWMQEAPDPTTHGVWGSWIDIHPSKAKALGIADGDIVELSTSAGKVEAPARVTEDVHESAVALAFGQGHTALGRNAKDRGANAFNLLGGPRSVVAADGQKQPDATERVPPGVLPFGQVAIKKTGRRAEPVLASSGVQDQHDRELLQWVTAEKLATLKPGEGPGLIMPLPEGYRADKDLYPPHDYKEHRWAMVVDLDRCIGCGACAVACYAENNLAVVGSEHTARGHHMPWLQVVPYRDPQDPHRLGFLPLPCQHCDQAPCEPVCPVYASVHNDEGLNAQVYNRCVGTRYCMNNCPYKVRRFNWFDYAFEKPLDWQLNPDVTVRVRGVMEKCTFCIQRIRAAEYRAKMENRKVRDGEVLPACVQSCPTRAYTFGDLLDPEAAVTKLTRLDPRRYHVLEQLNTKPGVAYLRRIKSV